jgi:hypothetical protein
MKSDWMDRIRDVETAYQVETIEYEGIKIWPFIRWAIYDIYFRYAVSTINENKPNRNSIFFKIGRGLRALAMTSLSILFKKHASILFTDDCASELRYIDGKLTDVFAIPVVEFEKYIIPIVVKTRSASITVFARYVNSDFFSIWTKLYSYIKKIDKEKIMNRQVLVKIISDLEIEFDIEKYILRIFSFFVIFRLYFRLINPKNIFLICYYGIDRMTASYVAKEMRIPVVELQHGLINNEHFAYTTKVSIEPNSYPNYLFCFGEGFKKFVSPFVCNEKNIFIIGNHYIDYIRKNKNANFFTKKYSHINSKIVITVANQDMFANAELEFIERISECRQDIYFIYIPRTITSKLTYYSHKNISIETELNVYQCMQNSHITSTVHSTCAVESLAFGTPVILINIRNLARTIYADFFSPSDAVFCADTPEEYVSCIATALNRDRKQIASDATYYYAENPQERTRKAFKKLAEHSKGSINE